MNIAILGYADQGESSYRYWNTAENELTICDRDTTIQVPKGAQTQLGDTYLQNLDRFDRIIRTPALHPRDIVAANPEAPQILEKVWSNTNEFMKVCPSRNIIGVTGTKGKGTTSTLIANMLQKAGMRVHLGGNIGTPPLDMLKDNIQPDDWVILELANFQLIDLQESPPLAVCLMVVPEHMDWHTDFDEYTTAKQQLFAHQKSDDVAIYYAENPVSSEIVSASPGHKMPYFAIPGAIINNDAVNIQDQVICKTSDLKLLGKHNWQNVCAAVTAAWQITQDIDAVRSALTDFTGLPYRLELRAKKQGIRYYNDSFAATPDACMAAIDSIPGQKIMIIGGFDRNLSISHLAAKIKENTATIRQVVLVGASADRVTQTLHAINCNNFAICESKNMQEIVKFATSYAKENDAVVLSPGFASFDMFKNFEDRGNQFNAAVEKL